MAESSTYEKERLLLLTTSHTIKPFGQGYKGFASWTLGNKSSFVLFPPSIRIDIYLVFVPLQVVDLELRHRELLVHEKPFNID